MRPVLVVEDDWDICSVIVDALASEGFQVVAANDGDEALAVLANVRPAVILLDLYMPGRSGWLLLADLRQRGEFADIPVVVCTGMSSDLLPTGIADHLRKPFSIDALLGAVKPFTASNPTALG